MDDNQDKREHIDLPETDEPEIEATPAAPSFARRLLMARELRGWMAVAAALVVATAAIAPTIDYHDLTGFVAPKVGATALGGEGCSDEDQSGGFGGQHVGCDFSCSDGAGAVSISVRADDSDAGVSGTASCGGGQAHCSGSQTCTSSDPKTGGGSGDCSADSDEAVDSGLYVECSAAASNLPYHPGPNPGSQWCPVEGAPCINTVCYQLATASLVDKCQVVWQRMQGVVGTETTSTAYAVGPDGGAGLACKGLVCVPFEPVCARLQGRTYCTP
jgi:hypothetical protein